MGAVLSQLCEDHKWHTVGFTSKSLSSAERNYEIHDKELLFVIQGLEEWRHILEGTKHTIEILNDHWTSHTSGVPEPEPPASTLVPLPVQV